MRAAAIALTLLVASSALADRDRDRDRDHDNDPIVLNERRIQERLDQIEKLLEKIEKEKNKKDRSRLVSKARGELDELRKMVRRAPELEQRPEVPGQVRPPAGLPQPPPVVHRPPPPPVVYPMADAALQDLMRAIKRESFSENRLRVLQQAVPGHYFVVAQAQQVLSIFSFSGDRLAAMRLLKPRLLDRENFFKLYDSFSFSSEKAELKKILEQ